MSKHTPGPWRLRITSKGDLASHLGHPLLIHNSAGKYVANATLYGKRERGEAVANAQLIAAAPDLYEALVAISAAVSQCENVSDELAVKTANAAIAIAKAKGINQ